MQGPMSLKYGNDINIKTCLLTCWAGRLNEMIVWWEVFAYVDDDITFCRSPLFVFGQNLSQITTFSNYSWKTFGTYPVVPRDRVWFGLGVGPHFARQDHIIPLFDRTQVDIGLELNRHRGRVCKKHPERIYMPTQANEIHKHSLGSSQQKWNGACATVKTQIFMRIPQP
jgi:hypothetical protein